MAFIEAKEKWAMPSPAAYAWCDASSGPSQSVEGFSTLTLSQADHSNMTVIYGMSFVGVALIAFGVTLLAFGVSNGNFVAGAGCLFFAAAGVWMRLTDRRHSTLKN